MSKITQWSVWRLAWVLLITLAIAEMVICVFFWTYFIDHLALSVAIGRASLLSYVVFGFATSSLTAFRWSKQHIVEALSRSKRSPSLTGDSAPLRLGDADLRQLCRSDSLCRWSGRCGYHPSNRLAIRTGSQ
jgi:hypothetical protein